MSYVEDVVERASPALADRWVDDCSRSHGDQLAPAAILGTVLFDA